METKPRKIKAAIKEMRLNAEKRKAELEKIEKVVRISQKSNE